MAVAEPTGNTENDCVSGVAEVRAPVVGVPVAGQLQEPGGGSGGHVRVQGSEGRHRRLPAGRAGALRNLGVETHQTDEILQGLVLGLLAGGTLYPADHGDLSISRIQEFQSRDRLGPQARPTTNSPFWPETILLKKRLSERTYVELHIEDII